jgi:hypothetical protein
MRGAQRWGAFCLFDLLQRTIYIHHIERGEAIGPFFLFYGASHVLAPLQPSHLQLASRGRHARRAHRRNADDLLVQLMNGPIGISPRG